MLCWEEHRILPKKENLGEPWRSWDWEGREVGQEAGFAREESDAGQLLLCSWLRKEPFLEA